VFSIPGYFNPIQGNCQYPPTFTYQINNSKGDFFYVYKAGQHYPIATPPEVWGLGLPPMLSITVTETVPEVADRLLKFI
jgi:hypothetical protein